MKTRLTPFLGVMDSKRSRCKHTRFVLASIVFEPPDKFEVGEVDDGNFALGEGEKNDGFGSHKRVLSTSHRLEVCQMLGVGLEWSYE